MKLQPIAVALLCVATWLIACSDDGNSSNDSSAGGNTSGGVGGTTGGTQGMGGGSGLTGVGGDTTVTTSTGATGVMRAAAAMTVEGSCGYAGNFDIPAVSGARPVTSAGATQSYAQGEMVGAETFGMTCKIVNDTSGPAVSAVLALGNQYLEVSGPLSSDTQVVGIMIEDFGLGYYLGQAENESCTGRVLSSTAKSYLIELSCTKLQEVSSGSTTCTLGSSYLYVENCSLVSS